jgi:hypothetical protein
MSFLMGRRAVSRSATPEKAPIRQSHASESDPNANIFNKKQYYT